MTYAENLSRKLAASAIPAYMHEGIVQYILYGRPVGDFLTAVLSNDLKEACAHADDTNRHLLWEYVNFFYNDSPSSCWGSFDKLHTWQEQRGMEAVLPAANDARRI